MTKEDRKFKSESIRNPVYNIAKEEFPFTKFKSQIILMTKNYFRSHITINYDKSASHHALISLTLQQKKLYKNNTIMCSCDHLRKLVAKERPVGRMSLEPWFGISN